MAIKDTSKKPYIIDNQEEVFVGLDLPIRKGTDKQGYFASTTTTIEAVKNNIRNLLNTTPQERLYYPTFGLNLRTLLFNNIDESTEITVQQNIVDTFKFWLPFVNIQNIQINTQSTEPSLNTNTISVNIVFNIVQDPDTTASITLDFNDNVSEETFNSGPDSTLG